MNIKRAAGSSGDKRLALPKQSSLRRVKRSQLTKRILLPNLENENKSKGNDILDLNEAAESLRREMQAEIATIKTDLVERESDIASKAKEIASLQACLAEKESEIEAKAQANENIKAQLAEQASHDDDAASSLHRRSKTKQRAISELQAEVTSLQELVAEGRQLERTR